MFLWQTVCHVLFLIYGYEELAVIWRKNVFFYVAVICELVKSAILSK